MMSKSGAADDGDCDDDVDGVLSERLRKAALRKIRVKNTPKISVVSPKFACVSHICQFCDVSGKL